MISIVILSVNNELFQQTCNSIDNSVRVPFEIIKISNETGKHTLARGYNLGGRKAKYQNLVFIHEDIKFHTPNWDSILLSYFDSLENPGVLGVAGSSYLPISPSDWWLSDSKYLHANILSNDKNGKVGNGKLKNWGKQEPQQVFALDGMFLAMKKLVWSEFPFDESLEGFHGYDTSICLRVSQKYQNYFIPDILIEHFSKGYPNKAWLINTVQAKNCILPSIRGIRKDQILDKKLELKTYHLFLNQLKKFSDNWVYSVKYSWFYLLKVNQTFFSLKSWVLWIAFQGVFLLRSVKK